jgi:DMSO reductase anchor subunit
MNRQLNGQKAAMEILGPKKQWIWRWPAVANFVLGGAGAGSYLLFFVLEITYAGIDIASLGGTIKLLTPLMVCLGFAALTLEAGRPLRGFYMFSRLRRSWISVEISAGSAFIFLAVLDLLFPSAVFRLPAVLTGLIYLASHGFIFYHARAVTAWNTWPVHLLFFASALSAGGGLMLIAGFFQKTVPGDHILMAVQISLVLEMAAWAIYLMTSSDRNFINSTAFLRRPVSLFFINGLGQLFPFVAITGLLVLGSAGLPEIRTILGVLTGVAILCGTLSQKTAIMLGAGFMRGLVLSEPKENAPGLSRAHDSVRTCK